MSSSTAAPSTCPEGHVQIRFISNTGSITVNVPAGTTIEVVLQNQGVSAADNTVRVNRQAAAPGQVVQDGDVVSATPKKVAGNR